MKCEEHKCKEEPQGTDIKYILNLKDQTTMKVCETHMDKWFYSKSDVK